MTVYDLLLIILWITFLAYWLISGRKIKVHIRKDDIYIRLYVAIVVILLWSIPLVRQFLTQSGVSSISLSPIVNIIGIILCIAGFMLAIWARVHLGRNWGMPMSVKKDAELVTTGPYAYIRHPIYAGILLAMLGSALASIMWWLVAFVIFSIYLVYSSRVEEKMMIQQFPDKYPEYKNKTKMLIPFIF